MQYNQETNDDTYVELEETLIPYPDSFDIQNNNELRYILRFERPLEFQRYLMESRFDRVDNEDYETLSERISKLARWYHSTVYNVDSKILSSDNTILNSVDSFLSHDVLSAIHEHFEEVQEQLLETDIVVIRDDISFRFIPSIGKLLKKKTIHLSEITNNIIGFEQTNSSHQELYEIVLLISHPKRSTAVYGERSLVFSSIAAGEIIQILNSMFGRVNAGVRAKMYRHIFDAPVLGELGVNYTDSFVAAAFQVIPSDDGISVTKEQSERNQ